MHFLHELFAPTLLLFWENQGEPDDQDHILAATAVLSVLASTQVFAQAAIGSPGTFSFKEAACNLLNPLLQQFGCPWSGAAA
jgi:hypothetical protein